MFRYLSIIILIASLNTPYSAADEQENLKKVVSQINATEQARARDNNKRAKEIKSLRTAEQQINSQRKKYRQQAANKAKAQEKLNLTNAQLKSAQNEIKAQEKELAEVLSSLWLSRDSNGLSTLLSASGNDSQRHAYYYKQLNSAQQAAIDTYREKANKISELKSTQIAELNAIKVIEQDMANKLRTLEGDIKKRKKLVSQLNSKIKSNDAKLEKLKGERNQLTRVVAELQRAIESLKPGDAHTPFAKLKGKLQRPTKGKLVSSFNQTRRGSVKWKGHRYLASSGTDVKAVAYGRVVYANWLSGQGLLIAIDHGDDYLTLYAHNQSIFKDVGEWVQSGETIAEVGDSGGQSQSALYFEIRHKGKPQNPKYWLK